MADFFKTIALKPLLSEKAFNMVEKRNRYVFIVPLDVNRTTVAHAVESQFGVTVETVNMIRVKGKKKQTPRKGRRPIIGKSNDYKKAYVLVSEGQSIPIFQAEDEKKKPDAKAKGKK